MPVENEILKTDGLTLMDEGALFPELGHPTFLYDPSNYMIIGGEGIDCIVYDKELPLQELLHQEVKTEGMPLVIDVEMLISGEGAGNIMDISDVKDLSIESTYATDILRIGSSWTKKEECAGDTDFVAFANDEGLTMQLYVPAFSHVDFESEEAVFILQVV